MNDGGALLTKEQMLDRLRELARTSPVVAQGFELQRVAEMSNEETALAMAIAAVTALEATQEELRLTIMRAPRPMLVDRRNVIDEG